MLLIDDTLVSEDLLTEAFSCDLARCKGGCCNSEGESGAPLDDDELEAMREVLPIVWADLSPRARKVIEEQGAFFRDKDGDWVTAVVDGHDCVYATYGPLQDAEGRPIGGSEGWCLCAIEKAFREGRFRTLPCYREGREPFMKPISCHLYPVRIKRIGDFTAVNYDRQDEMCGCAQRHGRRLGIRLYESLRDALVRRFGKEWYEQLEASAERVS